MIKRNVLRRSARQLPWGFRRAWFLQNLRTVIVGGAMIAVGLTLAWWLQVYLPWHTEEDVRGARLRSGIAQVTSTLVIPTGKRTSAPGIGIRLNLDGKAVLVKTDTPVHVGQTVEIDYRVGKSGLIYVERVEPL